MAKELKFVISGKSFSGQPVKLEREKIYGRSEIVVTDRNGHVCVGANLDPEGTLIIPAGAVKPGLLDDAGNWIEKSALRMIDENGREPTAVPSSFDGEIILTRKVLPEEFLDHIWKSVYQLDIPDLVPLIGNDIYAFPFSYRGGFSADDGFLLTAGGKCWLFAGESVDFSFIGIDEEGVLDDPDPEEAEATDELDFDMM